MGSTPMPETRGFNGKSSISALQAERRGALPLTSTKNGLLAQLGERRPYKALVVGSSPTEATISSIGKTIDYEVQEISKIWINVDLA